MQRQTLTSTWRAPFPTVLLWHGGHRLSPETGTRLRKHAGAQHGRGSWVYPISQCYLAAGVKLRGRHPSRLPRVGTAHPIKWPWAVPGQLKAELTTCMATETTALSLDRKEGPPALSYLHGSRPPVSQQGLGGHASPCCHRCNRGDGCDIGLASCHEERPSGSLR